MYIITSNNKEQKIGASARGRTGAARPPSATGCNRSGACRRARARGRVGALVAVGSDLGMIVACIRESEDGR